MNHFLSMESMPKKTTMNLLELGNKFRKFRYVFDKQLFAANLFFEPSTRTKMSFMVAEKKLGMEILDFSAETSSVQKGESLYDTVKTFEAIGADLLVVRHVEDDWAKHLQAHLSIPLINAGAGKKDHPTQSLLDADTIFQEFGTFNQLKIVIAGDIKHSRVARSNAQLLTKLGAKVFLTGAPNFIDKTLPYPYISMDEAVEIADVMMLLRIQHERHKSNQIDEHYYHEKYGLTLNREQKMQSHAIILHPGPVNRGMEIDPNLVECEKSRIFKQMENGVYIRMAIITTQLLQWGLINENQIIQCDSTKRQSTIAMRCVN